MRFPSLADGVTVDLDPADVFDGPVTLSNLEGVTIKANGATIRADLPVTGWQRPFELIRCAGVQVFDLNVIGSRPALEGYRAEYAGQHGFAVLGSSDVTLCRVSSQQSWGDGLYIGAYNDVSSTNVIACRSRLVGAARQGVSTVAAEDVLIHSCTIQAARTGFNLEAHPNKGGVHRFEASDIDLQWGLRAITGTGEGDVCDVTFRDLRCSPLMKFSAEVYGPGAEYMTADPRLYGARRNWRLERFTGGKPTKDPKYAKFCFITGLEVVDVPFPLTTTGST